MKYISILILLLFLLTNKKVSAQNIDSESSENSRIPLIGIKTNLFYWAGFTPEMKWKQVLPNLSLEYFFANRWSVTLDGAYTSRVRNDYNISKRYAFSSVGSEVRAWLNNDGLFKGFYGGIYGNGGEFDSTPETMDDKGYTGRYIGTGLTVGYTRMFTPWLGVEVGVRGGFRHVAYDAYYRESSCYVYEHTRYKNNLCLDGVFLNLTARFGKYKK